MDARPGIPKYAQVAETVRAQVAEGKLLPGQLAPSAAQLARNTGYAVPTCRKGLNRLVGDGVLVRAASGSAQRRVAGPPQPLAERDLAGAARDLSDALSSRRHAHGLTQSELAERIGYKVTTVGHAETGRLWQSRTFWERADKVLDAGGALLALHNAYQEAEAAALTAGTAPPDPPRPPGDSATLLTVGERRILQQADLLNALTAGQIEAAEDLAEVRAAIRLIRRTVLAQAAARACALSSL